VRQVHRDLDELEAFGFTIERHPLLGVAYRGPSERLCPDQIEFGLEPRRIGRRIAVWNRVASTNDLAARASGSRGNEGLVIVAEEQSAGRGRRGRVWTAPPQSSILMSVLLFPPETLAQPAWLTALGALAAALVAEQFTGFPARIKWPNDVRVEGRKLAGVLVERGAGAVLGIGLNANLGTNDFPEDLQQTATSLQLILGASVDRSEVARALIERLDELYDQGLTHGPQALQESWRARLESIGLRVRVQTTSGVLCGRLLDADLVSGLQMETGDGRDGRIATHEVVALTCDDEPGAGI
jgi:BirA family biotin operon repressor/biotin-[acetyl-CoA-carboxylase] ligase